MLRFLVLIAIVLALSEALPAGPWYNIGERVKVTWSNDEVLKSMGRPLNPPVFRPQDRAARQGRSAGPEPLGGGRGSWYNKGQKGANIKWSNDQVLTDMGRSLNPPYPRNLTDST